MPSDYTHLQFGRKAIKLLPKIFTQATKDFPQLFDIGLQGPDILFFYEPLHKCRINQIGYAMHDASAKDFFFSAREILNTKFDGENRSEILDKNILSRSAALAYLAGFLCHYTLDLTCHGYIEKKISVSNLTHGQIEKEFDRYLMVKERGCVAKVKSTTEIVASQKNADIIAAFFPGVSPKEMKKALKSMVFFTNVLSGKGFRRPLVTAVLKISGQYNKLFDMLIPRTSPQGSEDSNLRLEKLMDKALLLYSELSEKYETFLQGGPFPEELSKTFGPDDNWRDIPVLTIEEEKLYEI